MGFYNVLNPTTMVAGAPEDISQVLANFNAIAAVLNGGLDNSNVNASAGIDQLKLALPFMGRNLGWSKGSLPPASPSDGDLWLYQADISAGVDWLFRYNAGSASGYKWECVGGSPVLSGPAGSLNTTTTGYTDLTSGPTFTTPRAGDYRLSWGILGICTAFTSVYYALAQVLCAGAPSATIQVAMTMQWMGNSAAYAWQFNGVAAGSPVKIQCQNDRAGAGTTQWGAAWFTIIPVRVS
jgi:hypothetical protein